MNKQHEVEVIFVCMGNICRSPAGEGVMQKLVDDSNLAHRIGVDSAGTISYHTGEPADARMRSTADRRGFLLDSIARQIKPHDLERFDLVIAMDQENLSNIRSLDTRGTHADKIKLLSDFSPPDSTAGIDVPDPYYGGQHGFDLVLDMIEAACPNILTHLTKLLTK